VERRYFLYYYTFAAGVVTLGITLSRCVCVLRISLGGEGNALYYFMHWPLTDSSFLTEHQHTTGHFEYHKDFFYKKVAGCEY